MQLGPGSKELDEVRRPTIQMPPNNMFGRPKTGLPDVRPMKTISMRATNFVMSDEYTGSNNHSSEINVKNATQCIKDTEIGRKTYEKFRPNAQMPKDDENFLSTTNADESIREQTT